MGKDGKFSRSCQCTSLVYWIEYNCSCIDVYMIYNTENGIICQYGFSLRNNNYAIIGRK